MKFLFSTLAIFGLASVFFIPTTSIWGVAIGLVCVLVIAVILAIALFDRVAARLAIRMETRKQKKLPKRAVHKSSGIARRA